MEDLKYCNIFDGETVLYRGEVLSENGSSLRIKTLLTSEEITIETTDLVIERCVESYFNLFRTAIDEARDNPQVSKRDEALIFASQTPHLKLAELIGLRDLGFRKANSITEVTISHLKTRVKTVLAKELKSQLTYIKEDEDLSADEAEMMVSILCSAHDDYIELVKKSTSKKEILEAWPKVFVDNKINNYVLAGLCD